MVRIEVLAVGKELLIGRTVNTNAHWVGRRLALAGTMIRSMATVDDDLQEIADALRSSISRRPEMVIVMGGLGPTPDDMTLKGVAKGLGRPMVLNPKALSLIREHYAARGMPDVELTPSRRKMAVMPRGAEALENPVGTAPGARLVESGTAVVCLPGVPSEMRAIFRRSVEPEVASLVGEVSRKSVTLKLEGIYESTLAPEIQRELKRHPGVYIKSHPRGTREGVSRIELDVVVLERDGQEAGRIRDSIADEVTEFVRRSGGTLKSRSGLS